RYELGESWKIAVAQMRSNMTRSTLTALGVIIGIVAVTLMGTAIGGIQVGFDKSMAFLGDDVLYVGQWPWKNVDDWWNYRDRKKIKTEYADALNRMIAMTPNSNLAIAIPTSSVYRSVKYVDSEVNNILIRGTVSDYIITSTFDFKVGRFFNELESRGGANVCVIGYDVADALFPSASPLDKSVLINGQPFKTAGVEKHARSDQEFNRNRGTFHHWSFSVCGRDRNYEYHFREREGAHQGDRNTEGAGSAPADNSSSISDRVDRALSAWGVYRPSGRLPHVLVDWRGLSVVSYSFFVHSGAGEHGRVDIDRANFRICSSVVGISFGSGGGS